MHTERYSRWAFAVSLLAVGVLGLVLGEAVAVWAPLPKNVPAREAFTYASTLLSIACGLCLLVPRVAARCAASLVIFLMAWLFAFRVPSLFRAPTSAVSWESLGEIGVIVAGAGTLCVRTAASPGGVLRTFATGRSALRAAQALYGLAMVAFGSAHFAYVQETAALIPAWIPLHPAWVYFTGGTYIAAGVALLSGVIARPAAALSALQMGLFSLLVWVPLVIGRPRDAGPWSELLLSFALAASGWVIAAGMRPAATQAPDRH